MRQGDGSGLLGAGNPHNAEIGIIYVEAADSRQEILKAINTQEITGRKQIAIVLDEHNKAFRQPLDFDGLKNVRRGLKAQLVFIAPSGPGPANFARQRNFLVYSSLDSLKQALLTEGIPLAGGGGTGRVKSKPGGLLGGLGGRKTKLSSPQNQGKGNQGRLPGPSSALPSPPFSGQPGHPPSPSPLADVPTARLEPPNKKNVEEATSATVTGGMLLGDLENDDEALAPPSSVQANPDLPSPIAQGSSTSSSPTGPARPGASKPLAPRGIIAFPNVPATPKTTGKMSAVPGSPGKKGQISGKLPAAPDSHDTQSTNNPAPQTQGGAQSVPASSGQPANSPGRNNLTRTATAGAVIGASLSSGASVPTMNTTASSAGTAGAPSSTGGPGGTGSGPRTPLPPGSRPGSTRRRRWRRSLLLWCLIGLLLLSGLMAVAIVYAHGGNIGTLVNPNLTAQVTITPNSKQVQDQYLIVGTTSGTPDPAKNQVASRVLTATSPSKQATGNATGSTKAIQASGSLKIQNVSASAFVIASTTIRGTSGVPVSFSGSITVPGNGSINVTGFAVNPGAAGNIPTFDINGVGLNCCNNKVFVTNISAFTGGQDAIPNSVITQNDINNAVSQVASGLTANAQSGLQAQIKSNEQPVGDPPVCNTNATADHQPDAQAKTVTVTVTVTCTEAVYDAQGARQIAVNNLKKKATNDQALAPYLLDGQIATDLVSAAVVKASSQQVTIYMHAKGIWIYHFTDQMQQNLKRALLNKSKKDALTFLQNYPGVAAVEITISTGDKMPADVNTITLSIQMPPGAQSTGTPTGIPGTPGGSSTVTTPSTPTPLPTTFQTGS